MQSGFHLTMVNWIMECVTSVPYCLCINGDLHGYFKAKRALDKVTQCLLICLLW